MKLHPVTRLFPPMADAEFRELVDDIRAHGLREAVWTYREEVIDGAHRVAACQELGIDVRTREWDGQGSLAAFVISLNLRRRHLTPSQKAMIAAEALPMFEAEAKERLRVAGKAMREAQLAGVVAKLPLPQKAREQAAAVVGVSPRYVQDAKRITKQAPALAGEVRAGKTTLPKAVAQTRRGQHRPKTHPELRRHKAKAGTEQFARALDAVGVHLMVLREHYRAAPSDARRGVWLRGLRAARRTIATIIHHLEKHV